MFTNGSGQRQVTHGTERKPADTDAGEANTWAASTSTIWGTTSAAA